MLNIAILDTLYKEENENNISYYIKNAYKNHELPIKNIMISNSLLKLKEKIELLKNTDVFILSLLSDNIVNESIDFIKSIEPIVNNIFIIYIIDDNVNISKFVRPSIQPAGILLIPLEKSIIYNTINEIYVEKLKNKIKDKNKFFKIKNGSDYYMIDTDTISFFEAQGKKIAVKTNGQEITFYSNFDTILNQVSNNFIRCHKGYVVNINLIVQVNFTEMILILKDKCCIPISRTYKDNIKSLFELQEV